MHDKVFNFAKYLKYDGYQRGLGSMVYKVFDKKTSNRNKETGINSDVVFENKQLAKKLHKPIIRKSRKH